MRTSTKGEHLPQVLFLEMPMIPSQEGQIAETEASKTTHDIDEIRERIYKYLCTLLEHMTETFDESYAKGKIKGKDGI